MLQRLNAALERRRSAVIGISAIMLILLLWVLLMDWIVMPTYTHHGQERELPDVTEMLFDEAKVMLESRGFKIVKDQVKNDPDYPAGSVIFQNPAPYSKIKKGRRIYVTVSSGEVTVSVPKLIGTSERDAAFLLHQAGLTLGNVEYEYTGYYPAGVVCGQSLSPGTEVERKTLMDFTVSRGPLPDRFLVPNAVGMNVESAQKIIRGAGLNVGEITDELNRRLVPGTVLIQSVKPGSEVRQGTRIDLVVSRAE